MNDPWDVKCVRQAGQYVSCMKLNGVPLLPPVLSKECRKEMQYYKLLAKEVEKRISILQPYVIDTDSESEDNTDAPELPECEQSFELPQEEVKAGFNVSIEKITAITSKNIDKALSPIPCNNVTKIGGASIETSNSNSPKLIIDLNFNINENGKNVLETVKDPPHSPPLIDLPERDYNCTRRITQKVITEQEVITEVGTQRNNKQQKSMVEEVAKFNFNINKDALTDPFSDLTISQDGPSSLSSKSFTGSLNDLHRESIKDPSPKLVRQHSYTLLHPSPQLLAHLEVQSMNTGIEMTSISMSESVSNLNSPNKKRRSWDLESAKVKWSSMALELKQTNVVHNLNRNASNKTIVKQTIKKSPQRSPPSRAKTLSPEKRRNVPSKAMKCNNKPNSDNLPKPLLKSSSPVRNSATFVKEPGSPKLNAILDFDKTQSQASTPPSLEDSDDPAVRVRELYEKIQNQQLLQMANLVEKQKKEQLLLQQVFEEQNNLLFKQLKTIVPKSPIEAKEAWSDKHVLGDRGPVSLSQLINYKSPEPSLSSPVTSTLTETNHYINHCDNVLKKSRNITGSIKKQPIKSLSQNGSKIMSPKPQPDSRNRTNSPTQRHTPTSRKLNYDTSVSSDRDYEPMLTDRTNDTMADLNVTFPSDNDDFTYHSTNVLNQVKVSHGPSLTSTANSNRATDNAIRNMERTIYNSMNSTNKRMSKGKFDIQGTPEQHAAATKIVAVAKGYLVRRLMRTDRVQSTVQTIKDALLCALQLHQDREGIRGADVDLHRRLIQQITAACYSLHDTFVASTASERCAMIAADRGRRRSLAARQASTSLKQTDVMSQSHSGVFPARTKRPTAVSPMTQSNYETFSEEKRSGVSVSRHMASPHRRPWR
ncbi:unnamed protein product [Spodoptera littoralis]|uniref:Centriolar coiled-coil protein of 110 kDa n=1 Tax=Spodoptera littoralis TaxID=7109 RepID=A0A9P0N1R9_SPOLI|nr:unnamed protein product [Spodoptera littoralis]CAH1638434.1 unnamed protein product [Spodoptera littoralis]